MKFGKLIFGIYLGIIDFKLKDNNKWFYGKFLLANCFLIIIYYYNTVSVKYKNDKFGTHCFEIGPSEGFLLSDSILS